MGPHLRRAHGGRAPLPRLDRNYRRDRLGWGGGGGGRRSPAERWSWWSFARDATAAVLSPLAPPPPPPRPRSQAASLAAFNNVGDVRENLNRTKGVDNGIASYDM